MGLVWGPGGSQRPGRQQPLVPPALKSLLRARQATRGIRRSSGDCSNPLEALWSCQVYRKAPGELGEGGGSGGCWVAARGWQPAVLAWTAHAPRAQLLSTAHTT